MKIQVSPASSIAVLAHRALKTFFFFFAHLKFLSTYPCHPYPGSSMTLVHTACYTQQLYVAMLLNTQMIILFGIYLHMHV